MLDTTPFPDCPIEPLGSLGATTLSGSFSLADRFSFVVTGGNIYGGPIFRLAETLSWITIGAWICDDHDFSTFRTSVEFSLDHDNVPPSIIIPHALGLLKPLPFLFGLVRHFHSRHHLADIFVRAQVEVEVSVSPLEGQAGLVDDDELSLETMAFAASAEHFLLLFPGINDSGIFVNSNSTIGGSETSCSSGYKSDGEEDGLDGESEETDAGAWFHSESSVGPSLDYYFHGWFFACRILQQR